MPELPKIADAPLSVVLLAPHAGDPVDLAVHDWLGWLGQRPGEAEVLVVLPDAESTSQGVASGDPRVRIVRHVAPPGNGAFLQSAAALVRYPLLLTATADRQFQPADASRLLAQIDQVHMVCGCRVAAPPFWLRALGLMKRIVTRVLLGYADEPRATWLGWPGLWRRVSTRLIFGVKLHDAACGLRLYRTEVLQRFPIQSMGSFAHVEVAAKANHLGCWMAEVPVSWVPSDSADVDSCWSADVKALRRRPQFTL
jgi:hypothetical protein